VRRPQEGLRDGVFGVSSDVTSRKLRLNRRPACGKHASASITIRRPYGSPALNR